MPNPAIGYQDRKQTFKALDAMCGDVVFKRKLKVQGAQARDKPTKPANPRL